MANLKAVKRKMSKWGVLGNAFLSVVLAVSLMPSYAAFGDDGQVNNDTSAWQSADVQAQNCESDAVDTDSVNGPAMAYDGFDESGSGAEPYAVELTAMGMLGANTVKISVPAADAGDELRAALGSATATLDPGSADDAAHASAKAALEAKFDGVGAFEAYSLKIVSGC